MTKSNLSSDYNLGETTKDFNIILFFTCFVFTIYAGDIALREQTISAFVLSVVSLVFIFVFLLFAIIETNSSKIIVGLGIVLLSIGGISSLYYHPSDKKLKFVCVDESCEEVVWRNPFTHFFAYTIDRNLGSDQIQAVAISKDDVPVTILLMSDYDIVDSKQFLSTVSTVIPKNRINTKNVNAFLEQEIRSATRRYIEQRSFEDIKRGELKTVLEGMVNPLKLQGEITIINIINTDE